MPSVKNPNTVGKNRQTALKSKARKASLKHRASAKLPTRIAKADARRGARAGLMPTSGPNAPLSSKKARKLEKQMAHAIRRKAEAEAAAEAQREETENAAKSKKALKTDRDAATQALEKMDIS